MMKRSMFFKKALCVIAALLLVATAFFPVMADNVMPSNRIPEYDQQKLYEFWHQEAYDGMNNGEAVYDYVFQENEHPLYTPAWNGDWRTELIGVGYSPENGYYYSFNFSYEIPYAIGDSILYDNILTVTPDLYGPLDLSGTKLISLISYGAHRTHLTSVNLDDCQPLNQVRLFDEDYLTEFSALNCPHLGKVFLSGHFRSIKASLEGFERPVQISAFGPGRVRLEYRSNTGSGASISAYSPTNLFVGWFDETGLVSTNPALIMEDGCDYHAVFAGDANGNGTIDVSDAIVALRAAMDITELTPEEVTACDVSGDGVITVADAIQILRAAMGIF
ncbi:MAG: dockerin type I repeat-containing protein [Clostridia bacterium]|nr:dockerin type I repeat-containing protein [Clostridia bacterium]